MGFPSDNIEGFYRNNIKDVKRFLDTIHRGHYRVYNLCSERKYNISQFYGNVAEYPFDDHGPPPLEMISQFCFDVENWLNKDPANIIAVHCKAGKGRTGTLIRTSPEAARLFGNKRTLNGKGITIPSQFRYVRYYEQMLSAGERPPRIPVPNFDNVLMESQPYAKVLTNIYMHGVPDFNIGGGCEPFLAISQKNKTVYYSKPLKLKKGTEIVEFDCGQTIVSHDVKITFYNKNSKGKMFSLCFHTAFVPGYYMLLRRQDLDRVSNDVAYKHFPATFQVELFFLPSEIQRRQQKQLKKENGANQLKNHQHDKKHTKPNNSPTGTIRNVGDQRRKQTPTTVLPSALLHTQSQLKFSPGNSNAPSQPEFNPNTVFKCTKCNQPVMADQVTVYHGAKTWHWSCMLCSVCEKPVRDDVIFNKEGEPVCVTCDKVFFKCCAACGLLIKSHVYEDVGELSWHKDCFACQICGKQVSDSKFILEKGKPMCQSCVSVKDPSLASTQYTTKKPPLEPTVRPPNKDKKVGGLASSSTPEYRVHPTERTPATHLSQVTLPIRPKSEVPHDPPQNPTNTLRGHPNQNKRAPELQSNPICPGCGNNIDIQTGERILAMGRIWHNNCFGCFCCGNRLDGGRFHIRNEQPCCDSCDSTWIRENYAPLCGGCEEPINDGEFTEALGSKWHMACFACVVCGAPISGNFTTKNGKIYCQRDYMETCAERCGKCRLPLTGSFFRVLERAYHMNCLECSLCGFSLANGQYYAVGGSPACLNCKLNSTKNYGKTVVDVRPDPPETEKKLLYEHRTTSWRKSRRITRTSIPALDLPADDFPQRDGHLTKTDSAPHLKFSSSLPASTNLSDPNGEPHPKTMPKSRSEFVTAKPSQLFKRAPDSPSQNNDGRYTQVGKARSYFVNNNGIAGDHRMANRGTVVNSRSPRRTISEEGNKMTDEKTTPPPWTKDKDAKDCQRCGKTFTFLFRKRGDGLQGLFHSPMPDSKIQDLLPSARV